MNNERISVNGFDGRVSFVCRYRDVNTYKLESAAVYPGDRVDITDDGRLYHPDQVFSWDRAAVLLAIAEYERRCHAAYVKWATDGGYPIDQPAHKVCAAA